MQGQLRRAWKAEETPGGAGGHHPGAKQGAGGLQEGRVFGAEGSIPTKGDPRVWGVRPSPGQVFEGQSQKPRRETQLWTQRSGFEFCSAIFSATFSSLLNTSSPQSPLL